MERNSLSNDIVKFISNSKYISGLDADDESQFYCSLKKTKNINKYGFENNFPYIFQATRYFPYKYLYKQSIVYFSLRSFENKFIVVIANALGLNRIKAITEFAKIANKLGIKIIVKNIDVSELKKWEKYGFCETTKPWSKYSFRDDNTFPQHIIGKETILNRSFNRSYRALFKKYIQKGARVEDFNKKNIDLAMNMLKMNANFLFQKGVESEKEVVDGHLFFFEDNIKNKLLIQHKIQDKFLGFSYLTVVNDIAFYNALFCLKESDLMKFLLYDGMRHTIKKYPNVQYVGIQGSENSGQDFFKVRYKPSLTLHKTHITLQDSFL